MFSTGLLKGGGDSCAARKLILVIQCRAWFSWLHVGYEIRGLSLRFLTRLILQCFDAPLSTISVRHVELGLLVFLRRNSGKDMSNNECVLQLLKTIFRGTQILRRLYVNVSTDVELDDS